MALTLSRTRNQTTLNALAKMLAALNGEYAFCLRYLDSDELKPDEFERMVRHVETLQSRRKALRITLYQFDQELDIESIRATDSWRKRFGGKRVSEPTLKKRLLAELMTSFKRPKPESDAPKRRLLLDGPLAVFETDKACERVCSGP